MHYLIINLMILTARQLGNILTSKAGLIYYYNIAFAQLSPRLFSLVGSFIVLHGDIMGSFSSFSGALSVIYFNI